MANVSVIGAGSWGLALARRLMSGTESRIFEKKSEK